MFHRSFLRILNGSDSLQQHYQEQQENQQQHQHQHQYQVESADDIIKTAGYFIKGVKRQQNLIETHPEYYIARDLKTATVYMCYKNILMLDLDNVVLDSNTLQERLPKEMSFQIYKTAKGYHAFCVSRKFEYRNKETVEFMYGFKDLGVDIDYIRYCYIRGFCVRLNKKFDGEKQENYKYITTTNPDKVDATLKTLVDLHIQKCKDYEHDLNIANMF